MSNIATKLIKLSVLCQEIAEEAARKSTYASREEELESQLRLKNNEIKFMKNALRLYFTNSQYKKWATTELQKFMNEP